MTQTAKPAAASGTGARSGATLWPAAPRQPLLEAAGAAEVRAVNTRILVVDDDPAICGLLKELLAPAGFDVLALTSSEQAARHMLKEKFDAIFLDVRMPQPDGVELARRARAAGFNMKTPIVMIAGDADPAIQKRCFEAGANFFLYKPFDKPRLLRILRVTQGSVQQERRRFQRVPMRCQVAIESRHEKLEGTTLDLSLNGMLVQASRAFPVGSPVQVALMLKAGQPPVLGRGKVARVLGGDCMGVQIDSITPGDSERLQEFLLPHILAATEQQQAQNGKAAQPPGPPKR
ncbi:MAG TPA: response regulator [Candidatus Nitrosotenuis sp.]|nr:response regulator [Candidatus Nitrosotenuis sp.]